MNKRVKEGIILAIMMMAIFGALDFLMNSSIADGRIAGFPLQYYSKYTGLTPPGEPYPQANFNPTNLAIDIAIPIIIGFGISYVKNSMVKK